MATQLVTMDDLQVFKLEFLSEVRDIVTSAVTPQRELLRNKDVKKMLGISTATLQTLRINGIIPYSKVGGTLYYKYSDVMKVFNENKHEGRAGDKPTTLEDLIVKEGKHGRV
jgi:hypothetical protein